MQCIHDHGWLILFNKSATLPTFSIHAIVKCHYSSQCCSRWLEANNLVCMQIWHKTKGQGGGSGDYATIKTIILYALF